MTRFIPKQFAENSTTSVVFGSFQEQGGNVGDGTISSDPATLQGGTAWPLGWKAATDNFFQIPRGEEMEGLERVLSAAIIQQFKDGLTFWQSEMPVTQYQTIVQYQTGSDLPKLYVNITGTSTSTPPDSDTTNWKEMSFFSRNIGEIVTSSVPLTDAGLHLADGSLISGSGSYAGFVTYMAGLVSTNPDLFETEANWQSSVYTYGVCGKYVYDSVNNTIRLPKYNSKIYTGGGEAPVIGNGMTLGLTNGSSYGGFYSNDSSAGAAESRAGMYGTTVSTTVSPSGAALNGRIGVTTDATKSGIIADLSKTSTACDVYYYVVIATSTKTAIEVDIDEIATDLNGKADIDASNFNTAGKSLLSGLGMPSGRYIDLTLGASGSSYTAPANGWLVLNKLSKGVGEEIRLTNSSNSLRGYATSSANYNMALDTMVPCLKGDVIDIYYSASGNVEDFKFIYAEGEN